MHNSKRGETLNGFSNIPQPLKEMNRWIVWRRKEQQNGKTTKVPCNAITGMPASVTDNNNHFSFDEAVSALFRHPQLAGLGIVLGEGLFGIDIDHCVQNGEISPKAQDIVQTMDSYTELSPSGCGIHILATGEIPGSCKRNGIEIYKDKRFFTVTGNTLNKSDVQERSKHAAKLIKKYNLSQAETAAPLTPHVQLDIDEQEFISRAFASTSDLMKFSDLFYNGADAQTLKEKGWSTSEGEMSLLRLIANATQYDISMMEKYFEKSAFMQQEERLKKWNRLKERMIGKIMVEAPAAIRTEKKTHLYNLYKSEEQEYKEKFFDYMKRYQLGTQTKTGFHNLDLLLDGMQNGLYVFGAISSIGKTTFVHQLAENLMELNNRKVLYFSFEMSRFDLWAKTISRMTGISSKRIKNGDVSEKIDEEQLFKIFKNFYIVEPSFSYTIDDIMSCANAFYFEYGEAPIIVVDYLQVISGRKEDRGDSKEKTDNIIKGLKMLQRDLQTIVLVISSINRTSYLDPMDFESFKESGGIEYTADVVFGLQLSVIRSQKFIEAKKVTVKREMIKKAKSSQTRAIDLVCVKNRYGTSSFMCHFEYTPSKEIFEPSLDSIMDGGEE